MEGTALIALAGIGLTGFACQWLAWRLKVPAILFLLLAGIAAGPVLGWMDPDTLFGELLFPFISLAVAVILFEGGLTLRIEEIRGLERIVRNLVTVGLGVTWVVIALATRFLMGFPWPLAWLFGALVVVTGPTVIIPMLRTVRPTARVANVLRWEGIVIDPLGALLAVLVYEFIISQATGGAWHHVLGTFVQTLGAGTVVGVSCGYGLGVALRRYWVPEFLHNMVALVLVLAAFTVANLLAEESGLVAVTVFGMWLANMKDVHTDEILDFKESLSLLLISGLFIILAARMEFGQFTALGWAGLGVLAVIQFVARPLKVVVSSLGSDLTGRERAMIAWVAPRGIVAAAVSAIFSIRLEEMGIPQAGLIVPLTFVVIIGTVVLQSLTARPLAMALGVAEPEPRGLLLVGANPVARAIAQTLKGQGFDSLLTDTSWDHVREARMLGLRTYFGNPVSEHADRHLDLVGLGRMLGLSVRPELNALAAVRYRGEFGRNAVYVLPLPKEQREKRAPGPEQGALTLFREDATYAKLASLLSQGAGLKVTPLSEDFDFAAYRARHGEGTIPLFALDPRGRLRIFTVEHPLEPAPGWSVIGLVPPAADETGKDRPEGPDQA